MDIIQDTNNLIKKFKWTVVVICFFYILLNSIIRLHYLAGLLLGPILELLATTVFLGLIDFNDLNKINFKYISFNTLLTTIVTGTLINIIRLVGFLLLIIPGFIWWAGYSQLYNIIKDRPEINPIELMTLCWKTMDGYKKKWLSLVGMLASELFFICGIPLLGTFFFFRGHIKEGRWMDLMHFLTNPYSLVPFSIGLLLLISYLLIIWIPKLQIQLSLFYIKNIRPQVLVEERS